MKLSHSVSLLAVGLLGISVPVLALAAAASPLKGLKVTGTGAISRADLQKMTVADYNLSYGSDDDGDGLSNEVQHALGLGRPTAKNKSVRKKNLIRSLDPDSGKRRPISSKLIAGLKGKLLAEPVGDVTYEWFVTGSGKAYFLGNAAINSEYKKFLGLVLPAVAIAENCDAFPDRLTACGAFKCRFEHPLTGDKLVKEITGLADGKCGYVEQTPGGMAVKCDYSESMRKAVAQYYRDSETSADGQPAASYVIDGKTTENPLQEAQDQGACAIVAK